MSIDLNGKKILLCGSTGMTGKATELLLRKKGAIVHGILRPQVDLTKNYTTDYAFCSGEESDIDYCIALCGYNGSILTNKKSPASIYGETVTMLMNVMNASTYFGVKKVVIPLTSCGYPGDYHQPFKEDTYMCGQPHKSVWPHGYARRAIYTYGRFLNQQSGNRFVFPVLNNLIGPNDRFNEPERLKFAGSLIRKIVEAKNRDEVCLYMYGTGKARRELTYSEDAAAFMVWCLEYYEDYEECINFGRQEDYTIEEYAEYIKELVGFKGYFNWETGGDDGQLMKMLDVSKLRRYACCQPHTAFQALQYTVDWYLEEQERSKELVSITAS